jgi:hypothetical protein
VVESIPATVLLGNALSTPFAAQNLFRFEHTAATSTISRRRPVLVRRSSADSDGEDSRNGLRATAQTRASPP